MLQLLNNAIVDHQGVRILVLLIEAAVAGAASMVLYRWCSPQQKMQAIKQALADVQQRMSSYQGEFSGLWVLIQENLRLAGKQVAYSLGPSLLAGIPVILLAINLDAVHRKLAAPTKQASTLISKPSETVPTPLTAENQLDDSPAHLLASTDTLNYISIGPAWLQSWVALFLVGCTVSAGGIRYAQGTI